MHKMLFSRKNKKQKTKKKTENILVTSKKKTLFGLGREIAWEFFFLCL